MRYRTTIKAEIDLEVEHEESPAVRLEFEDVLRTSLQVTLSTDGFGRIFIRQLEEEGGPRASHLQFKVGPVRSESRNQQR